MKIQISPPEADPPLAEKSKFQIGAAIAAIIILGGIGGVLFERFVLPQLGLLNPQAPIVITRREEVRITEGINQVEIAGRLKSAFVLIYIHEGEFDGGRPRILSAVSGVIVSSDGLIIVPSRSLRGSAAITVLTESRGWRGKVVGKDDLSGLSFIKIDAQNLPVVRTGFGRDILGGEKVLLLRMAEGGNLVVKSATASQRGVVATGFSFLYGMSEFNASLALDQPLDTSLLGGVVADKDGAVVGFITQVEKNILVLRAEETKLVLDNFLADKKIDWPSFQASYQILSEPHTGLLSLPKKYGVLVKSASPPLKENDFIFSVDGRELSPEENFQSLILAKRPDEKVKLKLIRDRQERELELGL